MLCFALVVTMSALTFQDPAPGISHALAKRRLERIGIISYGLEFDLRSGMQEVAGKIEIRFSAVRAEDLVLDWAGDMLEDVVLNGHEPEPRDMRRVHDHIVFAGRHILPGRNRLTARFKARVATTGTPLTVYHDTKDNAEYLYTLVVPADAHRLFPCFDQPDLKAMFNLKLTTPADWTAVANERLATPVKTLAAHALGKQRKLWDFQGTEPLPTYLFAFAAGPFAVVRGPVVDFSLEKLPDDEQPLRILLRKSKLPRLDSERLFAMHLDSVRWYERYFASRYPFSKLDMVLCPGFPYGGMEHAGAIFYRESALVFDHEPTAVESMRRSTLVYHEVAHQWFGNLVTMSWFDDLWLKEGFATYMAYMVLAALEPDKNAWLRFHQTVKPAAYRVDATPGTVPIWQSLDNLDNAKSNYGPIVYNKAPSVLRELDHRIGREVFRDGVRRFLKQFPFVNARWSNLLACFEAAGAKNLAPWSHKWILGKGMPKVRAVIENKDGKVTRFRIQQTSAQGWPTTPWPLQLDLLAENPLDPSKPYRVHVQSDATITDVPRMVGKPTPQWVLLNPNDYAYGLFLLDPKTVRALPGILMDAQLPFRDPLLRAIAFRALYDSLREAELAPQKFVEVAVTLLERERDPLTHASLVAAATETIARYLAPAGRETWRKNLDDQLRTQLLHGELTGLELQTFRALVRFAKSKQTLDLCRELAAGKHSVPGLKLGTQDRFLAVTALLAANDASAQPLLQKLEKTAKGDVAKYAYLARAAKPSAETKAHYFESYLNPENPPEQWVQTSLSTFHWPGQDVLTLPYLEPALKNVQWIKEHRKIFFMPAWIDAFINAHASPEALAIVKRFEQDKTMPQDIRRKLIQSADSLRRAIRIHERFWPK